MARLTAAQKAAAAAAQAAMAPAPAFYLPPADKLLANGWVPHHGLGDCWRWASSQAVGCFHIHLAIHHKRKELFIFHTQANLNPETFRKQYGKVAPKLTTVATAAEFANLITQYGWKRKPAPVATSPTSQQ